MPHAQSAGQFGFASDNGVKLPKDLRCGVLVPDLAYSAFSKTIVLPLGTLLKTLGSPSTLPNTFTGLAGLISFPRLAGVGPKKMQNAWPGGQ